MEFIKYNTTGAQPYNQAEIIKPVEGCNGFLAVNTGAVIGYVNDHILYPGVPGTSVGDSKTIGGNYGEIYVGNIRVRFDAGAGAEITIDQKQYILF